MRKEEKKKEKKREKEENWSSVPHCGEVNTTCCLRRKNPPK